MALDVSSIVIAVISLVGTAIVAGFTWWTTYFSDKQARRRESERLLAKYRDPLFLAAQDLQSRLYNICEVGIHRYYLLGGRERDNLLLYTAYLVGQFMSWSFILRRQAQFLRFDKDKLNAALTKALSEIAFHFSTDKVTLSKAGPFMLWRGEQSAIGEIMSVDLGDQGGYCLGYAEVEKRLRTGRRDIPPGEMGTVTNMSTGSGPLRAATGTITPRAESAEMESPYPLTPAVTTTDRPERLHEKLQYVMDPEARERLYPQGRSMALAPEFAYTGDFAPWFRSIILSTAEICQVKCQNDGIRKNCAMVRSDGRQAHKPGCSVAKCQDEEQVPDHRVRKLQHLLLDLMNLLDPKKLRSISDFTSHCHWAEPVVGEDFEDEKDWPKKRCPCDLCKRLDRCPACEQKPCRGPPPAKRKRTPTLTLATTTTTV